MEEISDLIISGNIIVKCLHFPSLYTIRECNCILI